MAACGPRIGEQRIEQRQVDHLPAAAVHLDLAQRDHRRRPRRRARRPRRRGTSAAAPARGRRSRSSRRSPTCPRSACRSRAGGGRARPGPSRRCARPPASDCAASSASGARPIFSSVPGRKLSTKTARRGHAASAAARAPRACAGRGTGSSCCARRASSGCATPFVCQARSVSPAGGSTLITSAPKSPSSCVSVLPATRRDRSSTRTPSSGPLAAGRVVPLIQP